MFCNTPAYDDALLGHTYCSSLHGKEKLTCDRSTALLWLIDSRSEVITTHMVQATTQTKPVYAVSLSV